MNLLVNETMQKAQPVSELGPTLFPGVDAALADKAVTTLVALGSAARQKPDEAGSVALPRACLLPRPAGAVGLPRPGVLGTRRQRAAPAGPIGRLYAQPQRDLRLRRAGVRVLHLPPLRLVLRPGVHRRRAGADLPLARAGRRVPGAAGAVPELSPLDLLLEEPTRAGRGRRHRPGDRRARPRAASANAHRRRLHPLQPGGRDRQLATTRMTSEDRPKPTASSSRAASAASMAGFGRSSVQDHQTKGDQPFQALVTRQIEVQPPSSAVRRLRAAARPQGAGVLGLAPGRRPPGAQPADLLDARRHPPLISEGWANSRPAGLDPQPAQPGAPVSWRHGRRQAMLKVRLRPELRGAESMDVMRDVTEAVDRSAHGRRPEPAHAA